MTHVEKWQSTIAKVVLVALAVSMVAFVRPVHAAGLSSLKDTMTRQKVSSPADILSNHEIMYTTSSGVASGGTIVITFPADFDATNDPAGPVGLTDIDLSEDTTPDGVCDTGDTEEVLVASGPTASQWSAVASGTERRILTFTSGGASATIAAASEVCIEIGLGAETGGSGTSRVINPTTTGSFSITIASGSDSGTLAVPIVDNDQVTLSATVDPSITFDLDTSIADGESATPYTVALGTLSSGTSTTSNHSTINSIFLDLNTNADSGAIVTVRGTNTGLNSASTGTTITLATAEETIAAGVQEIGLCVESVAATTGTFAAGTQYDSGGSAANCTIANGGSPTVGRIETSATEILNTSSAPISAGRAEILVKTSISGVTPAANDYTNTLTFIATGTF